MILTKVNQTKVGPRNNLPLGADEENLIPKERIVSIMPKETEARILHELSKQEEAFFYLQKDISLSMLATKLQTNPKYLSHVINTDKERDFNNYINDLRIGYAIDKLHHDPVYRKYKLAYIADDCGFSSHSKFGAIFKNSTGLSPSVFISHLKKNN